MTLYYILLSMRPRQWTKNLVVFAGLIFSQNLTDGQEFGDYNGISVVGEKIARAGRLALESGCRHPQR